MYETNKVNLYNFLVKEYPGKHIMYIGEGWSSIVFLVENKIFRFPKQNMDDYIFETEICKRLKKEILFDIPVIQINEHPFYPHAIHEKLDGKVWGSSRYTNLNSGLMYDCALFFYQTHRVNFATWMRQAPKNDEIDLNVLEQELLFYFSRQMVKGLLNKYETVSKGIIENKVFIHADFHGNNSVLDREGRLSGVFDWCNAGFGERERDFIHLYKNMDTFFMTGVFKEYYHLSGIYIDAERVKELTLVNMMENLFWRSKNNKMCNEICEKIEGFYK